MARRKPSTEKISCHDCGNGVSFSAVSCPHCGSTEPSGSYRFNATEARRARIEERNDRLLILMTVGLAAIGVFYGFKTSTSVLVAIIAAPLYGLLGAVIGARHSPSQSTFHAVGDRCSLYALRCPRRKSTISQFHSYWISEMSVKVLLAEMLRNELTTRGVNTLSPSDCEQIIGRLVEQLTELELSLAAREITDKTEP